MGRRNFIREMSAGILGLGSGGLFRYTTAGQIEKERLPKQISIDGDQIQYYTKSVKEPLRVMLVADTHLWMNDKRGDPYRKYSDRMAKAYNQTVHFQTGKNTNPEKSFDETLQLAVDSEVNLLVLLGDIFSWPSEAAIEWAYAKLNQAGVPYIYCRKS